MAHKTVTIRGEGVRLRWVTEIRGWDALQGDSYFQFRRDEIGTGWEISMSGPDRVHDSKNVVGRGETIQDAANNYAFAHKRAERGQKVTPEVVRNAAVQAVIENGEAEFPLVGLVERVASMLDKAMDSVHRDVVRVLRDMRGELGTRKYGRSTYVVRYNDGMRAAWRESDELAAKLGGESHHYTIDDAPAKITLTLEQARALAARLGGG